ncbi:MAG: hypothetical protein RH860_05535 [Cytophagales bacterium]
MPKSKKNTKAKKEVIEYSVIPKKKSEELNGLLEVIVDTLNGMGSDNKKASV